VDEGRQPEPHPGRSEGSLATTLEARSIWSCAPKPTETALVVVHYRNMLEALQSTERSSPPGRAPSSWRDKYILDLTGKSLDYARQ